MAPSSFASEESKKRYDTNVSINNKNRYNTDPEYREKMRAISKAKYYEERNARIASGETIATRKPRS